MKLETEKDFFSLFPTNEDAERFLMAQKKIIGKMCCPSCGNEKYYETREKMQKNRVICANQKCRKRWSVSSGTLFSSNKIPIQIQLYQLFIYLKDNDFSTCEMSPKTGLTQKSTWFFKRINIATIKSIPRTQSTYEDFVQLIRKMLQTPKTELTKNVYASYAKNRSNPSKIC